MVNRSPKTIRQEQTRTFIVEQAAALLKEAGRERFSLRQVAKRVNYSPAGLYEYFASKQQLIDAVAETIVDQLAETMREARSNSDDPVVDVAMCYVDFARNHHDDFLLVFGEKREASDEIAKRVYQVFLNTIASTSARNGSSVNPAKAAYRIWIGVHGFAMLQITHFGEVGQIESQRTQMKEFVSFLEA